MSINNSKKFQHGWIDYLDMSIWLLGIIMIVSSSASWFNYWQYTRNGLHSCAKVVDVNWRIKRSYASIFPTFITEDGREFVAQKSWFSIRIQESQESLIAIKKEYLARKCIDIWYLPGKEAEASISQIQKPFSSKNYLAWAMLSIWLFLAFGRYFLFKRGNK